MTTMARETAAAHLAANVPVTAPDSPAGEVLRSLAGRRFESASHIAVCEDGRLLGVVTIEELLAAPADAPARQLMDADPPAVAPGIDQEVVAARAVRHGKSALAVVDDGRRFLGFIPPHRLLTVLLWEHEEDLARLGGYIRGTAAARTASEEPVARRLWHRLPWLLVGLAGALLSANIVGSFEGQLEDKILLAFFIPGIVYLADAVGTQTEVLAIRGLSVGVGIGRVFVREVATGVLVGVALAAAFFPIGLWQWGDVDVAVAVSLALLGACSCATVVAMALPWLFQRLGLDPAFGSGPLATVAQDLLSLLIYFGVVLLVAV